MIFQTSIIVLFEVHLRFKGHFLNELRVSFRCMTLLSLLTLISYVYHFCFQGSSVFLNCKCFRRNFLNFSV